MPILLWRVCTRPWQLVAHDTWRTEAAEAGSCTCAQSQTVQMSLCAQSASSNLHRKAGMTLAIWYGHYCCCDVMCSPGELYGWEINSNIAKHALQNVHQFLSRCKGTTSASAV